MQHLSFETYEKSVNNIGSSSVFMAKTKNEDVLVASSMLGFTGENVGSGKICAPLNNENACVLRKLFPFCAPVRGLKKLKSISVDKIQALDIFKEKEIFPFFSKKMQDDATFTVYKEGYQKGFGFDGGLLKTEKEVETALEDGATMVTLDCSDKINKSVTLQSAPAASQDCIETYFDIKFDIEGIDLIFTPQEELNLCAAMYKDVIAFASDIYKKYFTGGKYKAELVISLDSNGFTTTPLHHYYLSNELLEAGVLLAAMSPGIKDEEELKVHAAITRSLGYKLSVTINEKNKSMFPVINKETRGNLHINTTPEFLANVLV